MNNMPGESDTESERGRKRKGRNGPYTPQKRRRLCIEDVPKCMSGEGRAIMRIPNELGKEVAGIIQKWKQDAHDQKELESSGDVQILGQMVGGCRKQLITLTEGGMEQLNQCVDQKEREKAGKSGHDFIRDVWDTIHEK